MATFSGELLGCQNVVVEKFNGTNVTHIEEKYQVGTNINVRIMISSGKI